MCLCICNRANSSKDDVLEMVGKYSRDSLDFQVHVRKWIIINFIVFIINNCFYYPVMYSKIIINVLATLIVLCVVSEDLFIWLLSI